MTETRKCLVCGKEFKARKHKLGRRKVYCSPACRCKAARMGLRAPSTADMPTARCPICGVVFRQDRINRPRKYCSCACAGIAKRGQTTASKESLRRLREARPKGPVSYAEIRRANLRRGNQDGWRGTPVMGGGGVVNMFSPVVNN